MKTRTDARGRTVSYDYNAFGQLTTIDYETDPDVAFTYDRQGRRQTMTDSSGTTSWSYDELGRMAGELQGRAQRELHFTHDDYSQVTAREVTSPAGGGSPWRTTYSYDNVGRVQSVLDDRLPVQRPFVYSYATNANLLAGVTTAFGHHVAKTYDNFGRLQRTINRRSDNGVIGSYAFTYDAAGQRDSETNHQGSRTFVYDAQRQLIDSITSDSGGVETASFTFGYDPIGNRRDVTRNLGSGVENTTYSANAVNQYTALTGGVVDAPAYDENGNTTTLRGMTLQYDEENRLVEASDATRTVTYVYDGLGRRVERVDTPAGGASTTTRFVYDGMEVIEEVDDSGVTTRSYTRGLDLSGSLDGAGGVGGLLAMSTPNGATWSTAEYYFDGNGNVTALVQEDGSSAAEYTYGPFGEVLSAPGPLAAANPYRFSSKERDAFTGLYCFGYRWYDEVTARWLTRDPLQEAGGANLYGFLNNGGINDVDPLGLASFWNNALTGAWAGAQKSLIGLAGLVGDTAANVGRVALMADETATRFGALGLDALGLRDTMLYNSLNRAADSYMQAEAMLADFQEALSEEEEALRWQVDKFWTGLTGADPCALGYKVASFTLEVLAPPGIAEASKAAKLARAARKIEAQLAKSERAIAKGQQALARAERLAAQQAARLDAPGIQNALRESALAKGSRGAAETTASLAAPGARVSIGGVQATQTAGRMSPAQMAALQRQHGVEFAQVYLTGAGRNGGGGAYYLIRGGQGSVQIPVGSNVRLINHTHPSILNGTAVPLRASGADLNVLRALQQAGSPQRTSQIVTEAGETILFRN